MIPGDIIGNLGNISSKLISFLVDNSTLGERERERQGAKTTALAESWHLEPKLPQINIGVFLINKLMFLGGLRYIEFNCVNFD